MDAYWHRRAERHPDLHYLLCEGVQVDGVRFWGAPWYSDLRGVSPQDAVVVEEEAMAWGPLDHTQEQLRAGNAFDSEAAMEPEGVRSKMPGGDAPPWPATRRPTAP